MPACEMVLKRLPKLAVCRRRGGGGGESEHETLSVSTQQSMPCCHAPCFLRLSTQLLFISASHFLQLTALWLLYAGRGNCTAPMTLLKAEPDTYATLLTLIDSVNATREQGYTTGPTCPLPCFHCPGEAKQRSCALATCSQAAPASPASPLAAGPIVATALCQCLPPTLIMQGPHSGAHTAPKPPLTTLECRRL